MIDKKQFKLIKAALISCLLIIQVIEVRGYEAAPIDWNKFTMPEMSDSLSVKIKTLTNTALKYVLHNEVDNLQTGGDGLYDFGGTHEYDIRPPAQAVMALGIAISLGIYDSLIVGKSLSEAKDIQVKLIESLVRKHIANGGSWGNCWQCAHWAFHAGAGAWLSWDLMDSATQGALTDMVVMEAGNFDTDPPYCNDCTDDSKAEENAWNANILAMALAMMPEHENAAWWKERASQWMISAYARESDLARDTVVDGKPVQDWITGWNMREEGYVYNHNRIHPDYTAAAEINLWNPVVFFLAGQIVPQAAFWNMDVVYKHLVDYEWSSPPFDAPGGTIYRRDSDSIYARVYYPQGTDWSANRIDAFFMIDIHAYAMGLDGTVSVPAIEWAKARTDYLLWMQSRSETGQLYIDSDNFNFPPKESMVASWFALSYLTLFLAEQEGWRSAENGFPFPVNIKKQYENISLPIQISYYDGSSGIEISLHDYNQIKNVFIFDINGKIIRTIPVFSPVVSWDFTDDPAERDKNSPAGIYILRIMGIDGKIHFNTLIQVLR
jgi:hypothetical protein